jgi:protein phosphatase
VVSAETLHHTLSTIEDLDDVTVQLIELAIRGGGPDNITCIVADVVDSATTALPPTDASVMAGAASNGSGGPHFRTDSPAGRAHLLTRTAPQVAVAIAHDDPAPQVPEEPEDEYSHRRRRLPLVKTALVILLVLVVGGAYAGWRYTQSQYYVAAQSGKVVIFRGINQSAAGINLSSVARRFDIPVAALPATDANSVRTTIMSSTGIAGALKIVDSIKADYVRCHNADVALQAWAAAPPKTVKKKVKNKTITTHVKPTKPSFPADCPAPPAGTASGTGGTS